MRSVYIARSYGSGTCNMVCKGGDGRGGEKRG